MDSVEKIARDYSAIIEHVRLIAKLFDPCGSASWFLLEFDPIERIAFGYVVGLQEDEYGYISLIEMESIKGPLGIGIEQDMYFTQKRLSCVK